MRGQLIKLFYAFTLIGLTIYSYSQLDLNLTLSSNPLYQAFQKLLIILGYYNRPLSTLILSVILGLLFLSFYFIYSYTQKNLFHLKDIIHLIIITLVILVFSYPAFSYDIFNYIFDVRILVKYGLNPYQYKALDFPLDPWIRFMRWTHRTYPYGPIWLIVTIPFYIIGFGKFVLTLLSFRFMFILTYLLNIYYLNKILLKLKWKNRLSKLAYFAFNPLIIIETLLSPHNESIMLLGLYLSIYSLLIEKHILSWITLLISSAVKFITFAILPLIFLYQYRKIKFNQFTKLSFWILLLINLIVMFFREPYPWYMITLIGVSVLTKNSKSIMYLIMGLSAGFLLRYLPFIYFGDYQPLMNSWRVFLTLIPIIVSGFFYAIHPSRNNTH